MSNVTRLFTLAATLSLAPALVAQPDAGHPPHDRGPRGRGPHPGSPLVRVLDADHNHAISAAEIANATAALKTLDADGDGNVSVDELRPKPPADAPRRPDHARRPRGDGPDRPHPGNGPDGARPGDGAHRPHPVDPLRLALDANGDGALSSAELANAPASLAALDANKDGQLTPDEFAPLPPPDAPEN